MSATWRWRCATYRQGAEVRVRVHVRVRQPPGGVPPGVVHQYPRVGAVGHVHEHVVAVTQEPVLQTGHVGLVVDHQIGQQRVGPQDLRRQRDAPQL